MGSTEVATKPHAVCIPAPSQSHIKAVLKFAKLLHHRGFHITFVNTEFNHKRFLKSLGSNSLDGLADFRFEAIPDSLPDSNEDTTQDGTLLAESVRKNFLAPFHALLLKLNNDAIETSSNPPVTCIVSDAFMSTFTITAAEEIGAPIVLFNTIAACSFMGFTQLRTVVEKGLAPLKDRTMLLFLPQRRLVQSQPAGSSDSRAEMEEMGWFLDVCIWRLRYFYRASLFSSSITDFLAFFSISFSVHRLPCLLLLHQFRFPFVIPVCYSPGLSLCSFIRAPVLCLNTPKSKGLDIWILLSFSSLDTLKSKGLDIWILLSFLRLLSFSFCIRVATSG